MVEMVANIEGPVYLRLGRCPLPVIYNDNQNRVGKRWLQGTTQ